jgi:anti-anti-sigma factor
VFGNSGIDIIKTMTEGSSRIANTNSGKNAMSNGNPDDAIKYLKQHGFEIELVNYSDKLPMILSLGGDTEAMKRLRKEYADIPQMVITAVRSDVQKQRSTGTGKFSVNMAVSGNELKCALSGRLDTITAPELLQKFNETTGDSINKITVDLTETEYISSAGLRVMLIMCKSLKEKREFSVINYSKELKEIFDVTGFSEIFGIG